VVIFDGTNTENLVLNDGAPCEWEIEDGALVVPCRQRENRGVWTKLHFRDAQIHVEFQLPEGEANSGIYFHGMVELQIYNSGEIATDPEQAMGAIYGIAPPLARAEQGPGEWQSFDIDFVAPRRDETGQVVKPGRITARLNGTVVQKDTPFTKPLSVWAPMTYRVPPYVKEINEQIARTDAGPLYLQDHDAPVRFRNIWIRCLDDHARVFEPTEVQKHGRE
jgi:hypothetical protein